MARSILPTMSKAVAMTSAFVAEHVGLILLVLLGATAFLVWQYRGRY